MEQIDPLSRDVCELMDMCIKAGIEIGCELEACQWLYVNYWQYYVPGFDCNRSYLDTLHAIAKTYRQKRLSLT